MTAPAVPISQPTSVDVCICTFRRDSLAETLRSVAGQDVPDGVAVRVIVADNDEQPSAEPLVAAKAAELGLSAEYLHAPARNISIARNAALDAARADWIAFIDDDEAASSNWLGALLREASFSDAEIVLGPVRPVYSPDAPEWMKRAAPHVSEPVYRRGRICAGYTSNVLFRRNAPATVGERFSLSLGRSGGEDTEFFDRLLRRGAGIAFAPDAVVSEPVPPERARFRWLVRRRYRFGQTHGSLLSEAAETPLHRTGQVLLAAGKVGYSVLGAALTAASPDRRAFWLLRAALHAGVVARLAGQREIVQYGGGTGSAPKAGQAAERTGDR